MSALILQCKTFQRFPTGWQKTGGGEGGGEAARRVGNRAARFSLRQERKDIDGYGDLMAYCSASDVDIAERYRFVMSSATLPDVGAQGRDPAY